VADSGFVYLTAVGSYSSGALIDAGWFLGYILIVLAARKAATGPATEAADPGGEDRAERPAGSDQLGLLLPYVAGAGPWSCPPWPRSSTAAWARSWAGSGRSSSSP
jgi:hypothetical protein